jgi:hypothetical protein
MNLELDTVVHACNPSNQELEAEESQIQGQNSHIALKPSVKNIS